MLNRKIAILVMCIAAHSAAADLTITAPDGRKILLRDDGTWAVIQDGADGEPRRYAALTLEKRPISPPDAAWVCACRTI